jgi:hypothetical protein
MFANSGPGDPVFPSDTLHRLFFQARQESKCQYFHDDSVPANSFQKPPQDLECSFACVFVGQLGNWLDTWVTRIDKNKFAVLTETYWVKMAGVTQH